MARNKVGASNGERKPRRSKQPKRPARPPRPPRKGPHFHAIYGEDADGRELVERVTVDAESAKNGLFREPKRVEQLPFTPSAHARRFWLIEFDWQPRFPRLEGLNPRQRHRAEEQWRQEVQSSSRPPSLVAVLPRLSCISEFYSDGTEGPLDRNEALLCVAERNAEHQRHWTSDSEYRRWAAIVEEGSLAAMPLGSVILEENGLGVLAVHSSSVVRIVRPTAVELARFPVPAKGRKGGGA